MKLLNMYILKKIIFMILLSFLTLNASENERLIVYGYTNYMPFMDGKGNNAQGLYPKIISAVFEKAGYDIEFRIRPWKRAYKTAVHKNASVGGALYKEERAKIFNYSEAIYEETILVYTLKSNKFNFRDLNDLKGKIVGTEGGFTYGDEFDKAQENKLFKSIPARSTEQNFKKLIRGRIDCLLTEKTVAAIYMKRNNLDDKVSTLKKEILKSKIHVLISKKTKHKNAIEKFNLALRSMKKDGSYNDIIEAFYSTKED